MAGALPSFASSNSVFNTMYIFELLAEITNDKTHALRIPGMTLMRASSMTTTNGDAAALLFFDDDAKTKTSLSESYAGRYGTSVLRRKAEKMEKKLMRKVRRMAWGRASLKVKLTSSVPSHVNVAVVPTDKNARISKMCPVARHAH